MTEHASSSSLQLQVSGRVVSGDRSGSILRFFFYTGTVVTIVNTKTGYCVKCHASNASCDLLERLLIIAVLLSFAFSYKGREFAKLMGIRQILWIKGANVLFSNFTYICGSFCFIYT